MESQNRSQNACNSRQPHALDRLIFRLSCPPQYRDEELDDYMERYNEIFRTEGRIAADKWAYNEAMSALKYSRIRYAYWMLRGIMWFARLLTASYFLAARPELSDGPDTH